MNASYDACTPLMNVQVCPRPEGPKDSRATVGDGQEVAAGIQKASGRFMKSSD